MGVGGAAFAARPVGTYVHCSAAITAGIGWPGRRSAVDTAQGGPVLSSDRPSRPGQYLYVWCTSGEQDSLNGCSPTTPFHVQL